LPVAVDEMRTAIRDAAWACDFDALAALGLPGEFLWSLSPNAADNPADHWRFMEPGAGALAGILHLFALPYGVREIDGVDVYEWPSAAAYPDWSSVPESDRSVLAGVYSPEDLERFALDDFYGGPQLGIDELGDWRWYLAGCDGC
jgi:hypothetical protein